MIKNPERKERKSVAVIGAGNAGAAAAYTLSRRGFDVVVFESTNTLGGRCQSVEREGFTIDIGAVYLLNLYSRTVALLKEAGYRDLQEWSPPGALFDDSGSHRVQYDFLPSFLKLTTLSLGDKLKMILTALSVILRPAPSPYDTDSLAAFEPGQETMETWSRRHLGDRVHEYLVRPWIEPAFGVGVEALSPPFLQGILKRAYRAKFRVPRAGMGEISKTLLKGINVELNSPVESVNRLAGNTGFSVTAKGKAIQFDGVVAATTANVTAEILGDDIISENEKSLLQQAPYAKMVSIALGYHKNPWPDAPFDLALPVGTGNQPIVGIILHGKKSPQNVPEGGQLINVFTNNKASQEFNTDTLCEMAINQVNQWLGGNCRPDFIECNVHERALAYAPPGHYQKMQSLRRAMPHGVVLAGDYLAHLGVETAIVSGERAGIELGRFLNKI